LASRQRAEGSCDRGLPAEPSPRASTRSNSHDARGSARVSHSSCPTVGASV
jgi:hypothetical protein